MLGSQLGLGGGGGGGSRNYQINILGGSANLAIAPTVESLGLPSHPLSVSAVHPLLVHTAGDTQTGGSSSSAQQNSGLSAASPFQITGLGISTSGGGLGGFGSSISPLFRSMRHSQPAAIGSSRSSRGSAGLFGSSRFGSGAAAIPNIQLQLGAPGATAASSSTSNAQQQQLVAMTASIRTATMPYNTLNEILQGYETPASALQQPAAATIITAPSATSFMDLLTGAAAAATGHHNSGAIGGTYIIY